MAYKTTFSARYFNHNSNYPKTHKWNIIIGLFDRTVSLIIPEHRTETLTIVKNTLLNNDYPLKLIQRIKATRNS